MARKIIGKGRKPPVFSTGHNWWSTSYGMPRKYIPKDPATQEEELKNSVLSLVKFSLDVHEIEADLKAIKDNLSLINHPAFYEEPKTVKTPCTVNSQSVIKSVSSSDQETQLIKEKTEEDLNCQL